MCSMDAQDAGMHWVHGSSGCRDAQHGCHGCMDILGAGMHWMDSVDALDAGMNWTDSMAAMATEDFGEVSGAHKLEEGD